MNEEGSIHVIEAVLAGMVVLGAIIFLTALSNPSPGEAESGIDLERVAADTLAILEDRPPEADCTTYATPLAAACDSRLEEIVHQAMTNDAGLSDADKFMKQVIPLGNRYLLRIDNGIDPLTLLPQPAVGVAVTPRAAKAAETFIVPQWQGFAGCPEAPVLPGTVGPDLSAVATLRAPTGHDKAPGGDAWIDWWTARQHPDIPNQVPTKAMHGCWDADGATFRVGLPDASTDRPAYAIQLVVWPIA